MRGPLPWRGLRRDRRGIAAVEAGLTLGVMLVPLLAGLVGVGQAIMLQYRVDRATHMALLYAWYAGANATTANIQTAASNGYGTGSGPAVTATASLACYCLDTTGTRTSSNTTAVTCPSSGSVTCTTSTQVMGKWATVTSSTSFTPVLIGSWNGAAWTMHNSSMVRIQ